MHGRYNSLSVHQIETHLQQIVGLILSEQRTIKTSAIAFALYPRQQQEWLLEWVKVLASNNLELAYQFVLQVPKALSLLKQEGVEAWIVEILGIYDKSGLQIALEYLQDIEHFAHRYSQQQSGLALVEIQTVLQTVLTGLDGRHLKVQSSEIVYTDTETLFLPSHLSYFVQRQDNFLLYKAMVGHLWAQTWFGTWRLNLRALSREFDNPEAAIQLFHTLERLRLDACLARELGGLYRDMGWLLAQFKQPRIPPGWETIAEILARPQATVEDSKRLLEKVYNWPVPPPVCYQGILAPERVAEVMNNRLQKEKRLFQEGLSEFSKQMPDDAQQPEGQQRFNVQPPESANAQSLQTLITMDGQTLELPEELKQIMASIIQDKGCLPNDYLIAPSSQDGQEAQYDTHPSIQEIEGEIYVYPEWDYRRRNYYKDWCTLREVSVPLESERFVTMTLQRYSGLLKNLRRIFEALRGGQQRLKRQKEGEEIDVDAFITAYADAQQGAEMSDWVFTKLQRVERSIAVMFMVDMSGSTKGWINQAERESLVLLCEVLERLGDSYAIYGFSGLTRKRCEVYPIKQFTEPYTGIVRQRISGIAPQEYTRMGVTIRHLTYRFKAVEAKIKLLITLSDGKPDDEGDNYRGTYGIEDTRQALIEAKREGIHPFCITIDTEAKAYLPHMYGAVNYTVIDKVSQLPLRVADIYRKLTT